LKLRTYEGMFLFDPSVASQWQTAENEVARIMERAGAELIGVKKWDERRLAYEIRHRKRGCYVLTYFRASGSSIAGIERDARLSEMVLRLLVLQCRLSEEKLDEFHKEAAEQSAMLRRAAEEAAKPPPAEEPAEPEPATAAATGDAAEVALADEAVSPVEDPPAETGAKGDAQGSAPEPSTSGEPAGEPAGDQKPDA